MQGNNNQDYPLYEVDKITNLRQLIEIRAKNSVKETAFAYERDGEKVEISYQQLKRDTEQFGTFLCMQSPEYAAVAVLGENSYEWILTFFAVTGSNRIIVPLDKEASVKELEDRIKDSNAEVLVYADTYKDIAEELEQRQDMQYLKDTDGLDVSMPVSKQRRGLQYWNMKNFAEYMRMGEEEIKKGNQSYLSHKIDEEAAAAIVYTSGTTGKSKGVMLTHKNFALDTYGACQIGGFHGDSMLLLPLHHTFGLVAGVFITMLYGYTIYINGSLRNLMPDFGKARPRNLFVVPLFVEMLYKNIWSGIAAQKKTEAVEKMIAENRKTGKDILQIREQFGFIIDQFGGKLEYIISGGAALSEKYIQGFADFGITVLNGYGITECSPVVCVNRNHFRKEGSVGKLLDFIQARIENPNKEGEGEICIKGDIVMKGYYHMKEATKEVLKDGWFHTGDLGHVDEDGFLYVTGRKKNLIILSNGENVSPEELEALLLQSPLIQEAVVYGKTAEDKIEAEIFPDDKEAEKQGIADINQALQEEIAKINRTLPRFKQISKVVTRDAEFEKTTTKKIKRK